MAVTRLGTGDPTAQWIYTQPCIIYPSCLEEVILRKSFHLRLFPCSPLCCVILTRIHTQTYTCAYTRKHESASTRTCVQVS